ncbi:unnamed protein product [Phyllotreta striolata]|uniref:Uncharacterized protein n=1 Tax=Phyllotreta striolata TaxID=444603 RepID=A0A9N9XQM6_PHYSR|nr:unnamed protein product [Phyllotreta striolata]
MEQEMLLKTELDALKDQITNLKAAIQALQSESEQKDVSIANLARDKEKITLDLLRTKRSNGNLAKQLEDERKFYFKEKEIYCHEMNECKRLKKLLSESTVGQQERAVEEYKNEVARLKQTLNQTLEANYNLSIKFLRMKNTKTCLKTELQTMQLEHEKLTNEYKSKIECLNTELNEALTEKIRETLSPSSKKYLQLVKQNSCLVYENLCLQLEVDNLNYKLEKLELKKSKSATNERLSYIPHRFPVDLRDPKELYADETPEKLANDEPKPCCSKTGEYETIKLYERATPASRRKEKKRKSKAKTEESKKKSVKSQTSIVSELLSNCKINVDDSYKEKISKYKPSKLALFQVSNVTSYTSTNVVGSLKRARSSPDILQTCNLP